MLRSAGPGLTLGVAVLHGLSSLVGQRQAKVTVHAGDSSQRIGDQVVVVDVAELCGVMLGAFGVESLQTSRPRFHGVSTDLNTGEGRRPPLGSVLRQRAHR